MTEPSEYFIILYKKKMNIGGIFVYHILLCDDEKDVLVQLKQYLLQFGQERGLPLDITACMSGEELLEMRLDYTDLIVLDIGMGKISGITAARKLRQRGVETTIIFLTSMVEYALDGYDVHAFAFIPKPVSSEMFTEKVSEALEDVAKRRGVMLLLKSGMASDYISSRDILYIDVQDHNIRIVFSNGSKTYYTKLQAVEDQLRGQGFFRCHKSFLVNFQYIREIRQDTVVMRNGDLVPLSKHRRYDFLTAFSKFVGRGIR